MPFCGSGSSGSLTPSSVCRRRKKATAFRRTSRSDLNWIFTVQTERVVEKDNTVAIKDRWWQIDKTRFRHSLAGSTITIHEHLDETVSIRYGPHVVGPLLPLGKTETVVARWERWESRVGRDSKECGSRLNLLWFSPASMLPPFPPRSCCLADQLFARLL